MKIKQIMKVIHPIEIYKGKKHKNKRCTCGCKTFLAPACPTKPIYH